MQKSNPVRFVCVQISMSAPSTTADAPRYARTPTAVSSALATATKKLCHPTASRAWVSSRCQDNVILPREGSYIIRASDERNMSPSVRRGKFLEYIAIMLSSRAHAYWYNSFPKLFCD